MTGGRWGAGRIGAWVSHLWRQTLRHRGMPRPLTRAEAIAAALPHARRGSLRDSRSRAVAVVAGPLREMDPRIGPGVAPPDRRLWKVTFEGSFAHGPILLGGHAEPANLRTWSPPVVARSMPVIVDNLTGALISAGPIPAAVIPGRRPQDVNDVG